ncbi:hypothetical protein FKM82_018246 [Ascaphus truei]
MSVVRDVPSEGLAALSRLSLLRNCASLLQTQACSLGDPPLMTSLPGRPRRQDDFRRSQSQEKYSTDGKPQGTDTTGYIWCINIGSSLHPRT